MRIRCLTYNFYYNVLKLYQYTRVLHYLKFYCGGKRVNQFFTWYGFATYSNKISIKIIDTLCLVNDYLQLSLTPEHIINVITVLMLPGAYIV